MPGPLPFPATLRHLRRGGALLLLAALSACPAPPQLLAQPVDATVTEPATARFAVNALAGDPVSHAWERQRATEAGFSAIDPAVEPSAATSAYVTPATSAALDHGARYRVKVTDPGGTVTSQAATLTVLASPPTLVAGPGSRTAVEGTSVTLEVSATGVGLSYRWQRQAGGGFEDLAGATGATLTFTGVGLEDAGRYRVLVSSGGGAVTSPEATLRVITRSQAGGVFVQDSGGVTSDPLLATLAGVGAAATADLAAGTFAATVSSATGPRFAYAGFLPPLRLYNDQPTAVTIAAGGLRAHLEGSYAHVARPNQRSLTQVIAVLLATVDGVQYQARGGHTVTFSYDGSGAITASTNRVHDPIVENGGVVAVGTATASALVMDLGLPALVIPPGQALAVTFLLQNEVSAASSDFSTVPARLSLTLPPGARLDTNAVAPLAW